jgi:hypothetical protein
VPKVSRSTPLTAQRKPAVVDNIQANKQNEATIKNKKKRTNQRVFLFFIVACFGATLVAIGCISVTLSGDGFMGI